MYPYDDLLKTGWAGDSQTRTLLVDSVLYRVFVSTQCILCSALRHKGYLTLPYVSSIRDSFSLELTRTALSGCRLAASRLLVGNYVQRRFSKLIIKGCLQNVNKNSSLLQQLITFFRRKTAVPFLKATLCSPKKLELRRIISPKIKGAVSRNSAKLVIAKCPLNPRET